MATASPPPPKEPPEVSAPSREDRGNKKKAVDTFVAFSSSRLGVSEWTPSMYGDAINLANAIPGSEMAKTKLKDFLKSRLFSAWTPVFHAEAERLAKEI